MLQKIKENKDKFIYGAGAGLTTALVAAAPVLAEGETGTGVGTTILSEFQNGVNEVKTVLIGIIGAVMVIIVTKLVFKAGVSFFKSSVTK